MGFFLERGSSTLKKKVHKNFNIVFAYDKKNNFFAEVNYGPRDKRILSKDEQPRDFLYGNIY